jgi:hypothetical protein
MKYTKIKLLFGFLPELIEGVFARRARTPSRKLSQKAVYKSKKYQNI